MENTVNITADTFNLPNNKSLIVEWMGEEFYSKIEQDKNAANFEGINELLNSIPKIRAAHRESVRRNIIDAPFVNEVYDYRGTYHA